MMPSLFAVNIVVIIINLIVIAFNIYWLMHR